MSKHKNSAYESDLRDSQNYTKLCNSTVSTSSWSNMDMEILTYFRSLTLEEKAEALTAMINIHEKRTSICQN